MIKKQIIRKEDVKPTRPDFEVIGAFNPAAIKYKDETLLLIRVAERPLQNDKDNYLVPIYDYTENRILIKKILKTDKNFDFSDKRLIINHKQNYLTSISHFRLARSTDGEHFTVSDTPAITPYGKYEEYGIEDARITQLGDEYLITYSAISSLGINSCLIKTKDFINFERAGIIFHSDNKDVVIFPEKISGKYYALHRPSTSQFGKLDIWIAESNNLLYWGNHKQLIGSRNDFFDNFRLGAGAVPFMTKYGWIEIYHSGSYDNVYCLGALLLDKFNPAKILKRSSNPLIYPEENYEINGFFGKVVFSCGAVVDGNTVRVYYGVSDENIAFATLNINEIYRNLGLE